MIKDTIYNLQSLSINKDYVKFKLFKHYIYQKKIIKMKHKKYYKKRLDIKLFPYSNQSISLTTLNINSTTKIPILIKHKIYNYYLDNYKIKNIYLIKNIEEFYRITKYFINIWNDKYNYAELRIRLCHDSIFYILKHREEELYDIDKYKKANLNNLFNDDLLAMLKQF